MSNLLSMIIGRKLTPEEQVKKWRQSIRANERDLDKQIRGIDAEEVKVQRNIKHAAKRGDKTSCKLLAKEIVRSRKAKNRLYTSKAQLNSMVMHLQQQLAAAKISGSLQKSSEIMKIVNSLVKLPEMQKNIHEMVQEMMKAEIIDEMIEDTLENAFDEEDLEEEADKEVEKVLFDITEGLMGMAGSVGPELTVEKEKQKEDAIESRLNALKAI